MSNSNHVLDACASSATTYAACGYWFHIGDINWGTVGATVLLIARLVTDVPKAIHGIKEYTKRNKKKPKKRKK